MKPIILLILLIFLPTFIFSQHNLVLDRKLRETVATQICQLLVDRYVFPDTAINMSNEIKRNLKEGKYDNITDPVAFADALTRDIYSVYHDMHLVIQYFPQEIVSNSVDVPMSAAPNQEDPLKIIKQANFGIRKLEILAGNIGYVCFDHFWADSLVGKETVKASLQFISHTKALIIDLRDCGGGSQESVNLICGYFLEKATHINDMFDRITNTTTEYWTKPDTAFRNITQMPLYILTSNKTFSAAEEFCYDLQTIKRATIIGETTGGGAHGTYSTEVGSGFTLSIPYSMAINPITRTNWEKCGVKPNIEVPADYALEKAETIIFDALMADISDTSEIFNLKWDLEILKAKNNPLTLDSLTLKKYAGTYGDRVFTYENGKLFYQRTGRPKFELEAMSQTLMKGKGNNYFKIEFVKNSQGNFDKVNAYYQDHRIETSIRPK